MCPLNWEGWCYRLGTGKYSACLHGGVVKLEEFCLRSDSDPNTFKQLGVQFRCIAPGRDEISACLGHRAQTFFELSAVVLGYVFGLSKN
jgi:hypothetical protein